MKCGLLGWKLGHSYSPQIHAMMGTYSYDLFEKEPEEVGEFVLHGDFDAINVTIPYKKDVIPYLDEVDPIEGSYTLEVSSAGADRALKKPEHFRQFMGTEVEIKLYRPRDGRKEHVGILTEYTEDGSVTIDVAGTPTTFEKKELAQVRLYVRF